MTGDGINDGPALMASDIGVARGRAGTNVAREIADVVLEGDDLQTMIVAVSQGRTIYNNIRKSIHFLMSTNLIEIAVMLASIGAGMGQPLNPMQLLWINLLTDVFPALALAMEPPEPDVLRNPPRDPGESIIRPSDLKRYGMESLAISAGTMASYGFAVARHGLGPQAGTVAFMTLTLGQLLHAYSCRSERQSIFSATKGPRNRYLDLAIGGSVALQILALLVPGLRTLLGTTRVNAMDVASIAAGATLPFLLNEASKAAVAAGPHRVTAAAPVRQLRHARRART
jgi:Ca2+-transporting ATPase